MMRTNVTFEMPSELAERFPLVQAWSMDEIVVPPTEEEKRRGDLRSDIQAALTSVRMPGGIFGTPRDVIASRDVGARHKRHYVLVGMWRGDLHDQRIVAQSLPLDTPYIDTTDHYAVREFVRAAEGIEDLIREGIDKHYPFECHVCKRRTCRKLDNEEQTPICGERNCLWYLPYETPYKVPTILVFKPEDS